MLGKPTELVEPDPPDELWSEEPVGGPGLVKPGGFESSGVGAGVADSEAEGVGENEAAGEPEAAADELGMGELVSQLWTVMVSVVVETVPPKAKARPTQVTVLPIVIPEASILVPTKELLAPRVVAAVGVQKTLQATAPPDKDTAELATVVSAPLIRKR